MVFQIYIFWLKIHKQSFLQAKDNKMRSLVGEIWWVNMFFARYLCFPAISHQLHCIYIIMIYFPIKQMFLVIGNKNLNMLGKWLKSLGIVGPLEEIQTATQPKGKLIN